MAKWTNAGIDDFLNVYFSVSPKRISLWLGLYLNDVEPPANVVPSDIIEVSGDGYSRIELLQANWTVGNGVATYPLQAFTSNGPWGDVYGYFISTVASGSGGIIVGLSHFINGPYPIVSSGGIIYVSPRIRMRTAS